MTEKKNQSKQDEEKKNQSKQDEEKKNQSKQDKGKKDQNKQKELEEDSLELMLEEQSRNQVRSDYRRSLGNEYRRRYME